MHYLAVQSNTLVGTRVIVFFLIDLNFHRDQRITQDVDRFCNETSQVLPKIILQPFLIAYYTYRTYEG